MKKLAIIPIILLFAFNFVSAAPHASANYHIVDESVFVEINFGNVSNFEFELPRDVKIFETNEENFEILDMGSHKLLKVSSSDNLMISYATDSLIDKTSNRFFFILKNKFNDSSSVHLELPEMGFLSEDSILVPDPDQITTDGRIITLIWNNFDEDELVVAYEVPSTDDFSIILIILIAAFVLYYLSKQKVKGKAKKEKPKTKESRKRKAAKAKKEITRNLFGEEKKIIEYLLEKRRKESWTKEIVKDLEISKVKLSRKLRSLQQKGLIEKIPHGNENRIRLLKRK